MPGILPHWEICVTIFRMRSKMPIKNDFSSGGLVWNKDQKKVLLIQVHNLQNQTVWTFPKGHPESKESDTEAALREVEEETGWKSTIVGSLMDVHYYYTHNNVKYHKLVRWFFMNPVKKVGDFNKEEVLDCRWVTLDEANGMIAYESDKKLIKKLSEVISQP